MWLAPVAALCILVAANVNGETTRRLQRRTRGVMYHSLGIKTFGASNGDIYQIVKKLGNGTFGDVYLAKDLTDPLSPNIAIKEIRLAPIECDEYSHCESIILDEQIIYPFECEVGALRLLNRLATDPFITREKVYIPMKVVAGNHASHIILSKYRELNNATTWDKLLEFNKFMKKVFTAANDSLVDLHSKGILHGNSELNNFMAKVSIIDGNEEISGEWIAFGNARLDYSSLSLNLISVPSFCYYNWRVYFDFQVHEEHEKLRRSAVNFLDNLGLFNKQDR